MHSGEMIPAAFATVLTVTQRKIRMPKQLDPCMFCGNLPCECAGPPQPKKRTTRKRAEPSQLGRPVENVNLPANAESVSVGGVAHLDIQAAMRAAVLPNDPTRNLSPTPSRPDFKSFIHETVSEEDTEFEQCINILAPLLHPDELKRYSDLITPRAKSAAWRVRNGG